MVLDAPYLRECFDLRLFIKLDADERALRRLLRDMQEAEPAAPSSSSPAITWRALATDKHFMSSHCGRMLI